MNINSLEKGTIETNFENSNILQKETFQKNADFIYSQWKPVQIEDFSTYILDIGKGEPVIFVPIARGIEAFDSLLIKELSKKYRIITFQRRENEEQILGLDSRSKDLERVINYLKLDKAHFISHSSGSIATTNYALKHPDKFLSYVWMNLSAKPAADLSAFRRFIASLAKYLPISGETVLEMLATTCAGGKKDSLLYERVYEQFNLVKESGIKDMKKWFVKNVWVMSQYDWSTGLEKLKFPILLLNSNNDLVNSVEAMSAIAKQLPNLHNYKIVNGGWHFFQYVNWKPTLQSIEKFYTELS